MGYRILEDDYYIQDITLPGGIPGQQRYGLRYDPDTGDYVLSQKSAAGYTIGIGLATLYQNGSWTSNAISDETLFENNDPNKPTQKAKDLSLDMNKKVYAAYQTLGGQSKGNKINQRALPQYQDQMGVENNFPGTSPPINVPGVTTPPGQGNIFDPINIDNIDLNFGAVDDVLKRYGPLQYPLDALYGNTQDHLEISIFKYKPPSQDQLFKSEPTDIIKNGLQRNTPLKEYINTIKLPIPNNISDSNNVSWGEDNLNNLSAAASAQVLQNFGPYVTAAGIGGAAGTGTGTGAGQGASLALLGMLLKDLGGAALGSPNAELLFKTGVTSRILSMAGFNVSPETILARGLGVIPNSNLELLFNAPTLREFSFQYRFSPRNRDEAISVNRIIRTFKQGMAAKKLNGSAGEASYFLGTPNVFKLRYRTEGGAQIEGVNKIKVCALTGFSVNYAADGNWSAYEKGQPVSSIVNMSFKELEPVYDTDYQENVLEERRGTGTQSTGDLDPVSPFDVGY
jgi:hypothetical protein